MKTMRTKLLGFLTAALLVLTFQSGAAFGGEKQYLLSVSPATTASSPAASPATFTFTFTNDGNSSFNSLALSLPTGFSIAVGATPSASRGGVTVNAARTVVTVNDINLPTGAGQFMTVTVPGVLASGTCTAAASGTWTAQPWTGSSVGNGQKFALKPGTDNPKTYVGPQCYTVSASAGANGSVAAPTSKTVIAGNTTSFTLQPASGFYSGPVTSTCGGSLSGNVFTTGPVNGNCTVTANFSTNPSITASATPSTGGSVSPPGTTSVSYNGSQSYTIATNTGYVLADVLVDGSSVGAVTSYSFTNVVSNRTIEARYNAKITATAGTGGGISPAGTVIVPYNTSQSFTIAASQYYRIADVKVNGASVGAVATYQFPNVQAPQAIDATFAANTLTVTWPDKVYIAPSTFDVVVTLDGPSAAVGVTATAPCQYTVTSTSTSTDGKTTTVTGNISKVPPTGSCTLTAAATGYPTQQKTFAVFTGSLDCYPNTYTGGELVPGALKTYVAAADQGKWGLVRGNNKPDSIGCQAVPYIFNLDIDPLKPQQLASFIIPDPLVSGQRVAAEYVVVWGRVAVDAGGDVSLWTTKRPKLSWGTVSAPVPGSNDFAPALSCVLDPDNPDLTAAGNNTYPDGFRSVPTTDLDKLLPVIPYVEPFITLGTTHPQYLPGKKAMMCVAQHGWTAVGQDDPLGPTLVQYWTRVIDQADGFMSLDN